MKNPNPFNSQDIIKELNKKGPVKSCQRCGTRSFEIAEGYVEISLAKNLGGFTNPNQKVPAIVVICKHCGHINFHAIGALGYDPDASLLSHFIQ
ncbi:MAG: hypothetical protein WD077_09065 [Bacteroidia bacterium]